MILVAWVYKVVVKVALPLVVARVFVGGKRLVVPLLLPYVALVATPILAIS